MIIISLENKLSEYVGYTNCSEYKIKKVSYVIKQNQSELGNIDFKIKPNEEENVFCFQLFWHALTTHISGTN